MITCIVQSCHSTASKNPNLAFFPIPKDSSVRDEWMDVLSLKNRQITDSTRICELHFRSKDFRDSVIGKKNLKHHALPVLRIGRKSMHSENSDEEFMQCGSDSDPEIVEVKEISKQLCAAKVKTEPTEENASPERQKTPEPEYGRRPSRRAAQLAVKKIHNTVRSFSLTAESADIELQNFPKDPPKTVITRVRKTYNAATKPAAVPRKLREQKTSHAKRLAAGETDLLMECHEELLTASQAEALMKAQAEYNSVMKMLRALKANNARIICANEDETEHTAPTVQPKLPATAPTTPQRSSSVVALTLPNQGQASTITVVPIQLVTVQPSSAIATMNPASPAMIISTMI